MEMCAELLMGSLVLTMGNIQQEQAGGLQTWVGTGAQMPDPRQVWRMELPAPPLGREGQGRARAQLPLFCHGNREASGGVVFADLGPAVGSLSSHIAGVSTEHFSTCTSCPQQTEIMLTCRGGHTSAHNTRALGQVLLHTVRCKKGTTE